MTTYVTKPFLPPLNEFLVDLEKIWGSGNLTNGGLYHQKFESELAKFLGVEYISLFTNATIGLITALQALRITGEVITTPYSFVATSHSLAWNGIKPVFVDIDPQTLNIDPKKIEAAITPLTTAILAVHCYGTPCDTDEIQKIADRYNLKVIYDAAHAFGVNCHCGSILQHGDLSILSFHATKVFNTFEGGAIISQNLKTKTQIDHLKNFGFVDETTVVASGINGKMSEFNSALGLLQLNYYESSRLNRQKSFIQYREKLEGIRGISIPIDPIRFTSNYGYFPILVKEEYPLNRDELFELLKSQGVMARRYFYPLISEFPMYRILESAKNDNLAVAFNTSRQVICLPLYTNLEHSTIQDICTIIASAHCR